MRGRAISWIAGLEGRREPLRSVRLLKGDVLGARGARGDVCPLELVRLVARERHAERDPAVVLEIAQDSRRSALVNEECDRLPIGVHDGADRPGVGGAGLRFTSSRKKKSATLFRTSTCAMSWISLVGWSARRVQAALQDGGFVKRT